MSTSEGVLNFDLFVEFTLSIYKIKYILLKTNCLFLITLLENITQTILSLSKIKKF